MFTIYPKQSFKVDIDMEAIPTFHIYADNRKNENLVTPTLKIRIST